MTEPFTIQFGQIGDSLPYASNEQKKAHADDGYWKWKYGWTYNQLGHGELGNFGVHYPYYTPPMPENNYYYYGCYDDLRPSRLLPDRHYLTPVGGKTTADLCYEKAQENNSKYFGLQSGGECWIENNQPNESVNPYKYGAGTSTFCANRDGGGWTNQLYVIRKLYTPLFEKVAQAKIKLDEIYAARERNKTRRDNIKNARDALITASAIINSVAKVETMRNAITTYDTVYAANTIEETFGVQLLFIADARNKVLGEFGIEGINNNRILTPLYNTVDGYYNTLSDEFITIGTINKDIIAINNNATTLKATGRAKIKAYFTEEYIKKLTPAATTLTEKAAISVANISKIRTEKADFENNNYKNANEDYISALSSITGHVDIASSINDNATLYSNTAFNKIIEAMQKIKSAEQFASNSNTLSNAKNSIDEAKILFTVTETNLTKTSTKITAMATSLIRVPALLTNARANIETIKTERQSISDVITYRDVTFNFSTLYPLDAEANEVDLSNVTVVSKIAIIDTKMEEIGAHFYDNLYNTVHTFDMTTLCDTLEANIDTLKTTTLSPIRIITDDTEAKLASSKLRSENILSSIAGEIARANEQSLKISAQNSQLQAANEEERQRIQAKIDAANLAKARKDVVVRNARATKAQLAYDRNLLQIQTLNKQHDLMGRLNRNISDINDMTTLEGFTNPVSTSSNQEINNYANSFNNSLALLDDPNQMTKSAFDTYLYMQDKKINELNNNLDILKSNINIQPKLSIKGIRSMNNSNILNVEEYIDPNSSRNTDTKYKGNGSSKYPNYLVYGNNGCLQYELPNIDNDSPTWEFKKCNANEPKQQFSINQINNLEQYNKPITNNNNKEYKMNHTSNIEFGFQTVNPNNALDQCLQLNNDGISVMPCTMDSSQRFSPNYHTVL